MNILVCAAKTGGHLFPALSFCKDAIRRGHKVIFLGSKNQLEQKRKSTLFSIFYFDDWLLN